MRDTRYHGDHDATSLNISPPDTSSAVRPSERGQQEVLGLNTESDGRSSSVSSNKLPSRRSAGLWSVLTLPEKHRGQKESASHE